MNTLDFKKRRENLFKKMEQLNYSLIIVSDPNYIYYLTGFHGALGIEWGRPELFLMTKKGESIFITPSMEEEMAYRQTTVTKILPWIDGLEDEWRKPLRYYLKKYKNKNIGVDYLTMPRVIWDFVTTYINLSNILDVSSIIDGMRMIKDQDEIQIARHAGDVAVSMLEGAMKAAAPGVHEFEVSLAAKKAGTYKAASLMEKYYQADAPFNHPAISNLQIMASGEHTTMCHHRNSMTKLEYGEPLFVCHCGTVNFKGFYLGFDRTLFIGEVNDETAHLQKIAEKTQKVALSHIKPGVAAEEVYYAYADVLQDAGYEIPFRTGRSLGFSFNESPQLAKGDKTILQEGMIFAVDGSASTEKYRVQVGDSILVTEDGFEYLTSFTKDPQKLVVGN